MAALKRLQGNPRILASLIVILIATLAGAWILAISPSSDWKMGVGAASLGAAASALATLIIHLLAEPDLRGVPRIFLEAVRREVHDKGYYRSDCRFRIELKEKEGELHFSYSSNIIQTKSPVEMPAPKVNPPEGLDGGPISIKYKYGDEEFTIGNKDGATIHLKREAKEGCTIIYKIQDSYSGPFRDDHRWTCPVWDGFEVTVRLPVGYEIEGSVLRGDSKTIMGFSGTGNENEYRYIERKASFSQQGFQWDIKKKS